MTMTDGHECAQVGKLLPLSHGPAQTVPERFQIFVIQCGFLNGFLIQRDCLFEPLLRLVKLVQLRSVAGEDVRDRSGQKKRAGVTGSS